MMDSQRLVALPEQEVRQRVTARDTILYALSIGEAGLRFVHKDGFGYKDRLKMLPTMAGLIASPASFWTDPEVSVASGEIVPVETAITLHAPVPAEGEFVSRTQIHAVDDKGPAKGAIVRQTRLIHDSSGLLLATVRNAALFRDDGGCGSAGEHRHKPPAMPGRDPDFVMSIATSADLPQFAWPIDGGDDVECDGPPAKGGPRLQREGMCALGVAGRAILSTLCDKDPARLRSIGARFTRPTYPGETIAIEIWRDAGHVAFRARASERKLLVLDRGFAQVA